METVRSSTTVSHYLHVVTGSVATWNLNPVLPGACFATADVGCIQRPVLRVACLESACAKSGSSACQR